MASQGFRDWVAAGRPYVLCRPCREFEALLKAAGYTVYDYPDDRHQLADLPEDHTPYSATGWPLPSARWVGHAVDVMPKAGLMPLPELARRIIAARDARTPGTEWIKYLNWTDEQGRCWHERWAADGTRITTSSTDKGHLHVSARSDYDNSDTVSASGWNPLEGDMPWTDASIKALTNRVDSIIDMDDVNPVGDNLKPEPNQLARAIRALGDGLKQVADDVAAVKARPVSLALSPEDRAAIVADLAAALLGREAAADRARADVLGAPPAP